MKREQIIEILHDESWSMNGDFVDESNFIHVADAILALNNESKLRESKIVESFERENQYVTDEDIEALVDEYFPNTLSVQWIEILKSGVRIGMKFMRDGKINPVSRDNDR